MLARGALLGPYAVRELFVLGRRIAEQRAAVVGRDRVAPAVVDLRARRAREELDVVRRDELALLGVVDLPNARRVRHDARRARRRRDLEVVVLAVLLHAGLADRAARQGDPEAIRVGLRERVFRRQREAPDLRGAVGGGAEIAGDRDEAVPLVHDHARARTEHGDVADLLTERHHARAALERLLVEDERAAGELLRDAEHVGVAREVRARDIHRLACDRGHVRGARGPHELRCPRLVARRDVRRVRRGNVGHRDAR